MDLLCMQYYLTVTPMLIANSSPLIGMLFRMVTKGSFVSIHLLALFCGLRWKQRKCVAFMSADCLNEMTIISFISMALWIADLLCFPCLLLSVMRIVKITWVSSLLLTTRQLLPWRGSTYSNIILLRRIYLIKLNPCKRDSVRQQSPTLRIISNCLAQF